MDTSHPPNLLPIPRLRLSRNAHYTQSDPIPGPSRLADGPVANLSGIDEHDDDAEGSTPRLMPKSLTHSQDQVADTPAARLRALLTSSTPKPLQTTAASPPKSPSLLESDFETPQMKPEKSSIDNVKQIFSLALREPGDTPQRTRRRRNSIDGSEVEGSPVKGSTVREKDKRRSLSDEEVDKPSSSYQSSVRSLQATTFNNLREKLENSRSQLRNMPLSKLFDMDNDSQDTASLLRELNQATPPAATSTPQRSLQMPLFSSQSSNLLEQDSEMNRAMKVIDSFEDSVPFPSGKAGEDFSRTPGPDDHITTLRRHSADLQSLSRRSMTSPQNSSPAHPTNRPRHVSDDHDKLREREREWNKPYRPETPELNHRHSYGSFSRSNSPMLSPGWSPAHKSLSRKSSAASLLSQDDDFSSRASSVSSQADYRERVKQFERERNLEREREWNKPHTKDHRSSSSMDHHSHSRSRIQSATARPASALSFASPDRLNKRHSFSSNSSIGSPSGSGEDFVNDIEHERERNWNSPHPQWKHGHSHSNGLTSRRSLSPLPPPTGMPPSSPTRSRYQDSSKAHPTTPVHNTSSHLPSAASYREDNRPASPLPTNDSVLTRRETDHNLSGYPSERQGTSLSASRAPHHKDVARSLDPSSTSLSVSPFPSNRLSLPPHVHGLSHIPVPRRPGSPITPGPRPSSRASGYVTSSRIPVKTPRKGAPSVLVDDPISLRPESLQPPIDEVEQLHPSNVDDLAPDNPLDATEESSASHEATPSLRNIDLPDEAVTRASPQSATSRSTDEARLQKAVPATSQELASSSTPSPDELRAETNPQPSILSTPPRRSSFNSSRIEFQTPSPPKGLPDLPGPPPSSSDETDIDGDNKGRPLHEQGPEFSMLKTPKPPGGWADTPAPQRSSLSKSQSISSELEQGFGLVTPRPSLSRASTLPLQTPAPPGGWMPTPAPRKSILKVRFDPQPDTSTTSSQGEASTTSASDTAVRIPLTPPEEVETHSNVKTPSPQTSVKSTGGNAPADSSSHTTPNAKRSLRKSPSIRMLDAYGRESTIEEPSLKSNEALNRSSLKIVDAMGREVEDPGDTSILSTDESSILDHNEALTRVRLGLNDLAHDMSDIDRSNDQISLDQTRLQELDTMSRAARETREKLSQTLRMARSSQELRNKIAPLRASIRRSQLFTYDVNPRSRWGNGWFLWGVLVLQVILVFAMYRISHKQARNIFLTTYYDPFNPDLHLYTIKPDIYQSHAWSIPTFRNVVYDKGWKSAITELWIYCTDVITKWRKHAWEMWGEENPRKWPPM